jgi:hypothetical protein
MPYHSGDKGNRVDPSLLQSAVIRGNRSVRAVDLYGFADAAQDGRIADMTSRSPPMSIYGVLRVLLRPAYRLIESSE